MSSRTARPSPTGPRPRCVASGRCSARWLAGGTWGLIVTALGPVLRRIPVEQLVERLGPQLLTVD
jgi:hypothetical protein